MKKPDWFERNFSLEFSQGPSLTFEMVQSFLNTVRDDGKVYFTPALYKGVPAIRAAVSNRQTEKHDMEIAFEAICRVLKTLQLSREQSVMHRPE